MMSTTVAVAFFMVGVSVAVVKWVNSALLLFAAKANLRNICSMKRAAEVRKK